MHARLNDDVSELAQVAARLVVEEGLEYGPAKRRAVKQLALPARTPLPANELIEDAVREYIALFCADTQPAELRALLLDIASLSAKALLPTALEVLNGSSLEKLVVGSIAGVLPKTKSLLYRLLKRSETAETPHDPRIIAFSKLIANKGDCATPAIDPPLPCP